MKDLDNNYLNDFNVVQKLMVKDNGCRNFVLKPKFKSLFSCKIMSHGHFDKNCLQIKNMC
jgi:hypothetical protein